MRIALFTDTYHQINGVSMVYQRFAGWCAEREVDLEIFTPGDHTAENLGSVTIHSIDMIAPLPYYRDLRYDLLPLRPKLNDYFEQRKFDLIHIATQGHMAILALKIAARQGLPKIACYHTALPEFAQSRAIRLFGDNPLGRLVSKIAGKLSWYYQKRIFRSSSLVLVPTRTTGEIIEQKVGVPTAIFSRGVDSEAFKPVDRAGAGRSEPISLFVGRISVEKNLALLERLDFESGELMLVGDGPYTDHLRRTLPSARFTGFLQGEALCKAYASADIFVFPSRTDTFGNAVLEAMSSGLAVLVTDSMGPKDFVEHEKTGLVASSDEEFVEFHRLLVGDSELRARLGANAREYAKSCDWNEIFETQLLGNYRKVIDGWAESRRS